MINSIEMPVKLVNNTYYSLSVVGAGKKHDTDCIYNSRQQAEKVMYKMVNKLGTKIVTIYEDHHDKTYICDNNVSFYIQRYC